MGLSLSVGLLIDLSAQDDEGTQYVKGQFEAVNKVLKAMNLGAHQEPTQLKEGLPWFGDMLGYSGLHYLRRIAAYLWAGKGLPEPGGNDPAKDAVVEEYYDRIVDPPSPILKRLFGRRASPTKRFDHLMLHSDAEGFYLPIDFAKVIIPPEELINITGGVIGSTPRLLAECEHIAKALGIPNTIEAESKEVFEAIKRQGEGAGWRRYGIESFSCLQLMKACRLSIASGAAVAFT